ncbi:hypothetical protein IMX26_06235 [Clostridium sp. 'deep sea']|uniref:hypothetical protein n=1 Tax=Clostridium sp. 'deep sea' TaxID=2779445 RepID=UPI0018969D73|nr:hypothetical protein [Clostridium sp. 'deep sea']QOR36404.1 hypothetical protein IMX26_06235 [Clostridium sp. 'deep sea']
MIYYGRLKKEFEAIAKKKSNIVDGQEVNYQGQYKFSVSNIASSRYKKSLNIVIIILTICVLFALLAYFNNPQENNPFLIWSVIIMFGLIDLLLIFSGQKIKKRMAESYFKYNNGYFEYCNGRKTYNFTGKDLERIDFYTVGRTSQWQLYITLSNYQNNGRFLFNILMYNKPKIIFALLLGAQRNTHVLF